MLFIIITYYLIYLNAPAVLTLCEVWFLLFLLCVSSPTQIPIKVLTKY